MILLTLTYHEHPLSFGDNDIDATTEKFLTVRSYDVTHIIKV